MDGGKTTWSVEDVGGEPEEWVVDAFRLSQSELFSGHVFLLADRVRFLSPQDEYHGRGRDQATEFRPICMCRTVASLNPSRACVARSAP